MVNFLSLLALFFSFSASAAVLPSGVPSIKIGATATNLDGLADVSLLQIGRLATPQVFTLTASNFSGSTANAVYPFSRDGVRYQVSTTASVKAFCFAITGNSDTANAYWQLMSDTVLFAENVAVGTLTAPVYQGRISANYTNKFSPTANVPAPIPGVYVFNNSSFPGIQLQSTATSTVSMTCFEQ